MSSYKELLAEREKLEKMITEAKARESAAVISDIRQKMADYGITLAELGGRKGAKPGNRSIVEPKYQDPETGKTWTGRGKPPAWIAGQDRESFLIRK